MAAAAEDRRVRPADPLVARFHRAVAAVTEQPLLHPNEKAAELARRPVWKRSARRELQQEWEQTERLAALEGVELVRAIADAVATLDLALVELQSLGRSRVAGKLAGERAAVADAGTHLGEARTAFAESRFEAAGKSVLAADALLWKLGGGLALALAGELEQAAFSRELKEQLTAAQAERRELRLAAERARREMRPAALRASVLVYQAVAQGHLLVAEALGRPMGDAAHSSGIRVGRSSDNRLHVVQPQDLPRMADVGGLEAAKETLQRTVGLRLEHPEEAARYGVAGNGILLYGPPGTGKTLLARALAGQHGLRYMRVAPATVASPYAHETARNLARVFELARAQAPCVLFLDEIDSLAAARTGLPSAEHREVVTQLLTLLEDYRTVRGLVIFAATNALDLLDPALREGRFDSRLSIPLPDAIARREILELHLRKRGEIVAWEGVDLAAIARRTAGRSGAALEQLVESAAQRALTAGGSLGQAELLAAADERVGRDRVRLEEPVTWADVVLPEALERRLKQLLRVFQQPEQAESLGVQVPAGILLHGLPGTGKTTIAKALASEAGASFYAVSAAEVLSKWVGESEERVQKLFARARDNRPSIVFIDEIESLLRRRTSDTGSPWEGRVVAQFLGELDGLRSGPGVFLVGATNRIDIIDEAIVERRLVPLEVPPPDLGGRRRLLEKLFPAARREADVDLDRLAETTEGMTGADLTHLRDAAGLLTLERMDQEAASGEARLAWVDIEQALEERRLPLNPE